MLWYNKTRGLVKKCPSKLQFGKYDQWKFSMANGLMLVQTKQKISVPDLHRQAQGICEKILDMLSVKLPEYHMLFDFRWEYLLYYIESDREVLSCCNVDDVPITITSRVIDLPDSQSKEIAMTIAMDDAISPYGVVTSDGFRSMILHTWERGRGFFCGQYRHNCYDSPERRDYVALYKMYGGGQRGKIEGTERGFS